MSPDPQWPDALSTGPAPEIPQGFLDALRARRTHRARTLAAGASLAAVALTLGLWTFLNHRPANSSQLPIAKIPDQSPELPTPARPITPEQLYRAVDIDLDRLAVSSPSNSDPLLRIGDHWDPERVRAWVLD